MTANNKVVLLRDTIICKTNQIQDSTPWFWSIGLPRLIIYGVRWTNTIQNNFTWHKESKRDFGMVSKEETARLAWCEAV